MPYFNFEKYTPGDYWSDSVIEDAKEIGALIGFRIDSVYFSGFWSQGDGACFTGDLYYAKGASKRIREYAPRDTELHDIADRWTALQRANFYAISGTVQHSGHYYHSGCTSFEFEDARYCYGWTNGGFDEDEAKQIARDFMDWIYARLEKEYEYAQAWELARTWSDLADELKEARQDARELIAAMRAEQKSGRTAAPAICDALRAQLAGLLATQEQHREERQAIADNFHYLDSDRKFWTVQDFAAANL